MKWAWFSIWIFILIGTSVKMLHVDILSNIDIKDIHSVSAVIVKHIIFYLFERNKSSKLLEMLTLALSDVCRLALHFQMKVLGNVFTISYNIFPLYVNIKYIWRLDLRKFVSVLVLYYAFKFWSIDAINRPFFLFVWDTEIIVIALKCKVENFGSMC